MAVRQNSCQPAPILSSANDLLHGADCTSISAAGEYRSELSSPSMRRPVALKRLFHASFKFGLSVSGFNDNAVSGLMLGNLETQEVMNRRECSRIP
jgi:hypothetical protein